METIRGIIAEYMPNEDISDEMVDKLYEYKNQRVIEELDKLKKDVSQISNTQKKIYIPFSKKEHRTRKEFEKEWAEVIKIPIPEELIPALEELEQR